MVELAGGAFLSCGLISTGTPDRYSVICWGTNSNGAMGRDISGGTDFAPGAVLEEGSLAPITDARLVAVGRVHGCVVRSDESVWCWGDDSSGQLGNDTSLSDRLVAVRVADLP